MSRPPISVVVIAKNEENNIDECLKSVYGWAEEIIVVDDESTDSTVARAQKYGARIFLRKMDTEGKHRNWAYAQAKNDWVFSLDADERVTDELKAEIDATLPSDVQGFTVPRRNYVGDYWYKYGGQYPAAQVRVFLKKNFRYEEVGVHPRLFFDGKMNHLRKDIIHKSYRDFAHFLAKLNGQTTLEAQKWVDTKRNMTLGIALWRTVDRFFRSFIGKQGWRDGFMGFMLAIFASLYQIMSYAKYYEMMKVVKQKK
ncbi:MAG: glycosyltransferase family 2 protein [Candidatus Omnitrophica bacterium]|nr:glycosyltransferase family 2 protein [Candidatus Omnitrophota bacterium]